MQFLKPALFFIQFCNNECHLFHCNEKLIIELKDIFDNEVHPSFNCLTHG